MAMGGASRLILLLHHPCPSFSRLSRRHCRTISISHSLLSTAPLHHHHHHHLSLFLSPPNSQSPLTLKASSHSHHHLHTQTNSNLSRDDFLSPHSEPWPEWSHLVHTLSNGGYFDRQAIGPEDQLVEAYGNFSEEFVRAASAALAFARSRPEILGLLSKKDVKVLVENGTPFLFQSAIDTERRMRSFLVGAGSCALVSEQAQTADLMKYILSYASNPTSSSERNHFYSRKVTESSVRDLLRESADLSCRLSESDMSPPEQYQVSGRYGQTPRLGQNVEMKRGDWLCPKCSFMNFARNMKCLECEEPRPRKQLTGGEWECPQCDFFNYGRNMVCLRCDCKRPGEAQLSRVNFRVAASEEKAQRWSQLNTESDVPARQNLRTDGSPFSISGSPRYGNLKGSNSSYVPFVPLPSTKFQKSIIEGREEAVTNGPELSFSKDHEQIGTGFVSNELPKQEGAFQVSEKPANTADRQNEEREQEEKSERWFKKVAELHNATNLTSSISDEDFPEIMPVRKGETRYLVSTKKDRSLTSPGYKKQQAMEQGSNSKFVPFVPFPPNYFAKEDKKQPESTDSAAKPMNRTSSHHTSHDNSNTTPGTTDMKHLHGKENKQIISEKFNSRSIVDHGRPTTGNPTSNPSGSHFIDNSSNNSHPSSNPSGSHIIENSSNNSQEQTKFEDLNAEESSRQPPTNQNVRSGWTGKSLEGSAVKELDPLDMSEEAKAERWFRRVAQIKDISELSQIPDEDFPSIMPMRKGVNRFVVSKRKTPLERRLTSPQYRKNLRIVSSDPVKKENDSS